MKRTMITKINTITIDSESLHKNAMEVKEEISDLIIKYLSDKKKKDKHYIYSFKIEKGKYRGKDKIISEGIKSRKIMPNNQEDNDLFSTSFGKKHARTNTSHLKLEIQEESQHIGKVSPKRKAFTSNIVKELIQFEAQDNQNHMQKPMFSNTHYPHTFRLHNKSIKPNLQNREKMNPYTKDQYIYMRNKKYDELIQLRKTGKIKRTNSILKSYQIATIQLNPHYHQRSVSYNPRTQMSTYSNPMHRKSKVNTAQTVVKRQSQKPEPWQWRMQESKLDF